MDRRGTDGLLFTATGGPIFVLHDTAEFSFRRSLPEKIGFIGTSNRGHDRKGRLRKHTCSCAHGQRRDRNCTGRLRPRFDPGSLLRTSGELSPNHDIKLRVESRPLMLRADPGTLDQICTNLNLFSNAVKYSPGCPEILMRAWQEGGEIIIEEQDHGLGMDEEDVGKLFERFFRAERATGIAGTGIGLNLIKMLIDQHGGFFTGLPLGH